MVRLINIIKQGLKRSVAADDPLDSTSTGASGKAGPAERAFSYRRPAVGEPLPARQEGEDPAELQSIYRELYATSRLALEQAIHKDKIEALIGKVVGAFEATPYSGLLLLSYSFSRKSYLAAHITNDVILTVGFAKSLGFSKEDMKDLGICAFCHDLGMSNFESISQKGQQLTGQEIEDIKQHPLRSADLVRPIFSEKIASIIMDVHERENGQGYPRGIPGAEIHLWAKIISVCDSFEALTHPRVFRPLYSPYEAIKIIIKKKDILFSDEVVKRFVDFLSIYPVGSFVRLNGGEVGLVTGSNIGLPTRPIVRVIVRENHEIDETGKSMDLGNQDFLYVTGILESEKEKELLQLLKPRGEVELDET